MTLELVESSQHNSIENCGSGVQSAVYYAIRLATTMDSDISYMIGIEEPELNMHPQAQRELIESFKDISKYPSSQFVITTHSTVIIDHLGHQSVVLCRKCKGQTRDIITTVAQTGNDFWDKYQITEERYSNFFEYKNSDFFFSNYVIITESPNDSGIISHLLERSHINVAELGITLIPANGEKNVKYPYSIVRELGIPFFCVVDRDVFQPYTGRNRRESIDDSGLPCYKPELKQSSPICGLISPTDQELLLKHFVNNKYELASDILEKYSIVSMRYAIEVDLIACRSFFDLFCDVLNITGEDRTTKFLAVARGEKIKELGVIRSVLAMHSTRNYPASYNRIIKKTRKMINTTNFL